MQRVTNCVLLKDNQVLLLQKPRRGWWVAPGGKMEPGESVRDSCIREYREETGIYLRNPNIKGIFTFIMKDGDKVLSEWMMFTFFATEADGLNLDESEEGKLNWHPIEEVKNLPMAAGDHHILEYMINGHRMIYGTFTYTPNFELISYRLDPS
ncbi:8-oxo-dGTP diphosphatase [Cytobacillus horneckiae]|uniref:8-oxo-dGTP diphosphatase n=1 Tax=Cytobacillus horneckiae TaxID=549687 RepID=A0A2N0ZDW1_9BACI|nr:8-oxo-dGTP diphosphatase [Cytobacillus horneckiae]NRG46262.1 8-oxo-dGTP diphosphatase [Bacillus sp. CRN 9]MBN6885353.1 8-oxo-dGTP diphosphatase [Cytobacillus horneckiae]MCM3178918.1 8-oxo-dGTP diphosphatase [Cytobacillus horneckiae]MEC1154134.1 8-oxo-dGTP diphosphatase [Cytobacillus horneckiae]MED2936321.1 8-oxo-dGTP diphosphatase [Cytobacillus horneckiae]